MIKDDKLNTIYNHQCKMLNVIKVLWLDNSFLLKVLLYFSFVKKKNSLFYVETLKGSLKINKLMNK